MKPQTHSCWLEQWSWFWRHHFSLLGQHGLGKQMGQNVYWPEKFDSGCLGGVLLIVMSLLEGPSGVPSGPTIFSDMHRCAFFCSKIYQLRAGSVFRTFLCVCVWGDSSSDSTEPPFAGLRTVHSGRQTLWVLLSPLPSLGVSITVSAEAYGC